MSYARTGNRFQSVIWNAKDAHTRIIRLGKASWGKVAASRNRETMVRLRALAGDNRETGKTARLVPIELTCCTLDEVERVARPARCPGINLVRIFSLFQLRRDEGHPAKLLR